MNTDEIRLTGTSYAVLALLDHLGEATPYDLKGALERSVANFWPVPHTTFYAEPTRLVKGGYLTMRQEANGRRRKLYSLTERGGEALQAWARSPEIAESQLRDEGTLKIFAGADPRVIFAQQAEWRQRKLEELEGYLAAVDELPETRHKEAVRATLLIGIAYEGVLVEMIDRYFSRQGLQASADSAP
ncbi:MAG TPA: PadR family transcriptional regulator [Solirubrobacteraceae bacterium]|jgi:DNA-binding PadR family transcriptional regulator